MVTVTENQAKERLAELLAAAEGGQTVAITRNGKAVVQMAAAPPVPNGEYDPDERIRRLTAPRSRAEQARYQQRMREWVRSVEEMREEFRKEGGLVSEEVIDEIFREMRGR